MAKRGVNPATGKRYEWEEKQKAIAEAQGPDLGAINRQLGLLKRQQKALRARDHLIDFIEFTAPHPDDPNNVDMSAYEAEIFHREIAKVLEEIERGLTPQEIAAGKVPITQLIFAMPPRHGKTRLATEGLATWYSGKHPDHDVAVAMATDLLATDVGANVRNTIISPQFKQVFPEYRLVRGGTAKDNIQTDRRGRLVFVGVGGTLNGRGAHLLLVDDVFKDDKEASSQTVRDSIWNWLVRVALRRRMGRKLTIFTMTRWHADDPIGRLTDPENPKYNAEEAKSWKIIRLPGLAEENDPLGRKPGEALWPTAKDGSVKYDRAYHLADQRRDPVGFAALTQQSPTVADGILFRRETLQFYDRLPDDLRFYCASDHAVGLKQRNDYTVLLKIGVDGQNNIYVVDCYWKKAQTDAVVEAMLAMGSGNMKPLFWWAEKGHISKSIGPFLRKRMLETGKYINLIEVTPTADKQQRAQSIVARAAMGKLWLPKLAWWTEKAVNEMLGFPNGLHDDFVDTLAYIGLGLQNQFGPGKKTTLASKEPPRFGTLDWVRYNERWADEQKRMRSAGDF